MSYQKLASGPIYIVIKSLQFNPAVSTKFLWQTIRDKGLTDEIPSLTNLKRKVIVPMYNMGLIQKTKAVDLPKGNFNGWHLDPRSALKRVHPSLRMKPLE
jgi:hypothetical protein